MMMRMSDRLTSQRDSTRDFLLLVFVLLLLLLLLSLFAPVSYFCIANLLFCYSATQPQVCLIKLCVTVSVRMNYLLIVYR